MFTILIFQLSDEQLDLGLSNANYVASSNSSLSSAGGSEISAGLSVFAELNALDAVDKEARRER